VILDLIVTDTCDGFTADIPSIQGCEGWAHEEEEAIKKVIDLLSYYVSLDSETEIKIDKARKTKNQSVYKIIFEK